MDEVFTIQVINRNGERFCINISGMVRFEVSDIDNRLILGNNKYYFDKDGYYEATEGIAKELN